MNTSVNSINEQLVDKKLAICDLNFKDYIRATNDAMNDINGYKNQRIRQYIESQRNYTQQQADKSQSMSSVPTEKNTIDIRSEPLQKQQINNPISVEPLLLPDDEGD